MIYYSFNVTKDFAYLLSISTISKKTHLFLSMDDHIVQKLKKDNISLIYTVVLMVNVTNTLANLFQVHVGRFKMEVIVSYKALISFGIFIFT